MFRNERSGRERKQKEKDRDENVESQHATRLRGRLDMIYTSYCSERYRFFVLYDLFADRVSV